MSDGHDKQSVYLGDRFLQVLEVDKSHVPPADVGTAMEDRVVESLRQIRPDLLIERSSRVYDFSQYAHLGVFPDFRRNYDLTEDALDDLHAAAEQLPPGAITARLMRQLHKVSTGVKANHGVVDALLGEMPEESLLKVDVTVAVPRTEDRPELMVALSAKWSLRTDRAQDCISQGNKLVAQRRGRMPHFGVITTETRPSMLRILADGSGAIDWVYHLDLPALRQAIELEAEERGSSQRPWSPKTTFDRLLRQRRLRDFDALLQVVKALPRSHDGSAPDLV
jgi:NgoMIV restriction enzyme